MPQADSVHWQPLGLRGVSVLEVLNEYSAKETPLSVDCPTFTGSTGAGVSLTGQSMSS